MAIRKIKDAKDLSTNELIYFKGHAKATYMSDGSTVEDAIIAETTRVEKALADEVEKLKDGDTIVGQAREIHSKNGKTVTDSFLTRTTAGSGTIGDGVATLKSVGGNIVKNIIDLSIVTATNSTKIDSGNISIFQRKSDDRFGFKIQTNRVVGHIYYFSCYIKTEIVDNVVFYIDSGAKYLSKSNNEWIHNSCITSAINTTSITTFNIGDPGSYKNSYAALSSLLLIDLTEMFGAGKEPTKEECDRLFGCMDALPQGLNIASPNTFKSTGFNQFNPNLIMTNKAIVDNAIVDGDKTLAIVPCLPCKVGTGENNGYCVHGEFGDDIKVYLTPLNPMEVEGELYMHELTKDTTTNTYVPKIKGYMLVEVPNATNLCVHLLWSEDCDRNAYEPYYESKVELPTIPEMSEYGLAGIQSSGTLVCDEIDFVKGVYRKKIGAVDMGSLAWNYYLDKFFAASLANAKDNTSTSVYSNCATSKYPSATPKEIYNETQTGVSLGSSGILIGGRVLVNDTNYTDATTFKAAMQGQILYYELAEPIEYPLPKVDNNYISSDYGVEEFVGSKVPLNANNLYYMRSLAGETRNFLDKLYDNIDKIDAKEVADYITSSITENKTAISKTVTSVDTSQVVDSIEENVVANAIRKTPQVLTDTEKQQARSNIGAQKELTLTVKDNGNIVVGNLQGQTKEFMPATPSGDPLHYAYIAAGAEYNDTDNHIVKDTPWKNNIDSVEYKAQWNLDVISGTVQTLTYNGKTYEYVDDNGTWKIIARVGDKMIWDDTKVIHRKGYYYLNGLGDITDEQMLSIYNIGRTVSPNSDALFESAIKGFVTNIPARLSGGEGTPISFYYICTYNTSIKVFRNTIISKTWSNTIHHAWRDCSKLRHIVPIVSINSITIAARISGAFYGCSSLVNCHLNLLTISVSFENSPLISKYSIVNTIKDATPTTAITITLHPDAYVRLVDDADIVAALEEKNTTLATEGKGGSISLVSA